MKKEELEKKLNQYRNYVEDDKMWLSFCKGEIRRLEKELKMYKRRVEQAQYSKDKNTKILNEIKRDLKEEL